jgi:hypothetical protein
MIELPVCRWRETSDPGYVLCTSPKMTGDLLDRGPCEEKYCVDCGTADLLPDEFIFCAKSGPRLAGRPGWRLCDHAEVRKLGRKTVTPKFCETCSHRVEFSLPAEPEFLRPVLRSFPLPLYRPRPCRFEHVSDFGEEMGAKIVQECIYGEPARHRRVCWNSKAMSGNFDLCARNHPTPPDNVRVCAGCEFYEAEPAPPAPPDEWTRHLLYFVYPIAGNGVWQRNVDQLLERIELFNGRRVCAIGYRSGTLVSKPERRGQRPPHALDIPETVRARLAGHGFEFVEFRDSAELGVIGETAAFPTLLESVSGFTGPGDVTFYAHAKGVSRPVNRGVSVHPWASLLYAANLDYWPIVAEVLKSKPMAGSLKTLGRAMNYPGMAHYSGTFFWFRNDAIFSRDWRNVPPIWGGVESWPGVVCKPDELGVVFFEEVIRELVTGYDFPRLRAVMRMFAAWSDSRAEVRRAGASPRPWLESWGYE